MRIIAGGSLIIDGVERCHAVLVQHDSPHSGVLLAVIGIALALVGPGALSIDARLFGWKRIDLTK